ncbi:ParB-like protein, partial [Acinetobacter baumannii]
YQQLPKNLGLKSATNPDGMQNNPYRSLVYFTRDIGYSKVANATDYTEFLWEDWFNKQIANNLVHPLSFYHTDASVYGAADVLATTEIKSDLTVSGSATGYQAAVAD